jgi:hypothetical protein
MRLLLVWYISTKFSKQHAATIFKEEEMKRATIGSSQKLGYICQVT